MRWTEEEKQYLIKNKNLSNKYIAKKLCRSPKAIEKKRWEYGLGRQQPIYEVTKGYVVLATGTIKECAEKTGLSEDTIRFCASPSHYNRIKGFDEFMVTRLEDDEIEVI